MKNSVPTKSIDIKNKWWLKDILYICIYLLFIGLFFTVSCKDENMMSVKGGYSNCYSSGDCPNGYYCDPEYGECLSKNDNSNNDYNAWDNNDNGEINNNENEATIQASLRQPISTDNYVFVLNASAGTLVKINHETLYVDSISVGTNPSILRVVPNSDTAVILNRGSGTISIVKASETQDSVVTIPLSQNYTHMELTPNGNYAVCYFDTNDPEVEEYLIDQEYNTVSDAKVAIIKLKSILEGETENTIFEKRVGYRPTELFIKSNSKKAFIACKSEINIIDFENFEQTALLKGIGISNITVHDIPFREVVSTKEGDYIFIRSSKTPKISVIDTTLEISHTIELLGTPTDLDISSDNKRAVAVMREESKVSIIDIPGDITSPDSIQTFDTSGSVAGQVVLPQVKYSNLDYALLFTNSIYTEEFSILNLENGAITPVLHVLTKAVKTITISPDGKNAMIIHRPVTSLDNVEETDEFESTINKKYGYTLIDIAELLTTGDVYSFTKITEVPESLFGFTADSTLATVSIYKNSASNKAVNEMHIINTSSQLFSGSVTLESPPKFIGFLPKANKHIAYIAQEHPAGRITFVDLDSVTVRTATGFELIEED